MVSDTADIPQELREMARSTAKVAARAGDGCDCPDCITSITDIIARALLSVRDAATKAERERCARIAETEGVYPELNVWAGGPEWYKHGKQIAAAIRQP